MNGKTDARDLDDETLRKNAIAAARGDRPFDILITGGTSIDMATGERRLAPHPRPGLSQRTQARVGLAQRPGIGQPGVVEVHREPYRADGRRASSTSSTGIPSRTG